MVIRSLGTFPKQVVITDNVSSNSWCHNFILSGEFNVIQY